MKTPFYILFLFSLSSLFAQVGIGNTNPNATIDITASNVSTPANTDGILIPRIDDFPITNPSALQDGMMVFVTGNGTPSKGFYYWDQNATSWATASGAKNIDDLSDGRTLSSSVFLGNNSGTTDDGSDNKNTGVGNFSLAATTTGSDNTAIGYQSLWSNTSGNQNTAVGLRSLTGNTTGNYNTGIGSYALNQNVDGDRNTATGYGAMYANVDGTNNVSLGYTSLRSNTSGMQNTAIGESAMFANLSGNSNVAVGQLALYQNTSSNNTAVGARSMADNTSGTSNVAMGSQSLFENTTGSSNAAIGTNAMLFNTTGGENVAVGHGALQSNTTQSGNVALGHNALNASVPSIAISKNTAVGRGSFPQATTAYRNTGMGYFSGYRTTTGVQNVVIGAEAFQNNITGSRNVVIGDNAGVTPTGVSVVNNVYLGQSSGLNYDGNNTSLLGYWAGQDGSGDRNVYIGHYAGRDAIGSDNVFLGRFAGDALTVDNVLLIENSGVTGIDNALVYGEFDNNIFRVNGELQIGNPTGTGYVLPTADGTANQVLTTDGSGQLSFTTPAGGASDADWFQEGTTTAPSAITDDIFTQGNVAIGKNTADAPLDIEVTGSMANLIAMKMVDNSTGTGDHIGMQQTLGGAHNESIKGIETYLTNTGTGLHTGMSVSVQNGTGNQTGNRTTVNGSIGNNTLFSGAIFNSGAGSTATQTGLNISVQQPSSQISYGAFNVLNASGASATGIKYGMYNLLDGGSGNHYGVYNDVRGTENNTKYGTYNLFGIGTTDTGGELYGTYNSFGSSITSTSSKYGNYTIIPTSLMGTHYGTYADVQNAAGYAGYFIGRMSLGNTTSNRYTMPAEDGTVGQVLTTDGAGTTSWASLGGGGTPSIVNVNTNTFTSIPGTNIWTLIPFNTENIDSNSEFNSATSQFSPTSAGYYRVFAKVFVDVVDTVELGIFVGGTLVAFSIHQPSTGGVRCALIDEIIELSTSDIVEIQCRSNSGTTSVYSGTIATAPRLTSLQIQQLH